MSSRRPLIRRTFSQERYEILIKRQQEGRATFLELTELDEIVNRDPSIREIVLIENHFMDDPDADKPNLPQPPEAIKPVHQPTLLEKIKAFISRLFVSAPSITL